MVYGLCRRLADDPDDAYQTVWEKVVGAWSRFDPHGAGTMSGWIATITRRTLVDRHRRRRVRGLPEAVEPLVDPGPDPEARASRTESQAHLEALLRELPFPQRHVLVAHHVHGVPLQELADEEGVALGTIKSRLHRGRAALAAKLGER
jgi:RNA polymerase sigma-70 factor (ECF subfamily)